MFYVYLMRAGKEHYKVGVTKNLVKRVKSIQTSNPNKIELVTSKLVELPYKIEVELCEKLKELATGGGKEWFILKDKAVIDLCIYIQQFPHIELSERVIVKDLLDRHLMWKKTIEKKLDIVLNNYQKAVVRTLPKETFNTKKESMVAERIEKLFEPIEPRKTTQELDDEILEDAKQVILLEGKASTSLLQRRLAIGYGRASRIIDKLERNGFIGSANGAKPREIMIEK
jgi:hypothetical protein